MGANSQASPDATECLPLQPQELAEGEFPSRRLWGLFAGPKQSVLASSYSPVGSWGRRADLLLWPLRGTSALLCRAPGKVTMHTGAPEFQGHACEGSLQQEPAELAQSSFPNTMAIFLHRFPHWPQPPDLPGGNSHRTRAVHPDIHPAFPPSTYLLCSYPQGLGDSG